MCLDILVGKTPEVYIDQIRGNDIYGKLEYFNPTGSIKDRAAQYVIRNLLDKKKITSETKIIESSSGNFGLKSFIFLFSFFIDYF